LERDGVRAIETGVMSHDVVRLLCLLGDGADRPLPDVAFASGHGLMLGRWCDPPQPPVQLRYQYRRRYVIHRPSLT
jgi:hypothetical protein